ncbi:hypothetical protein L596_023114 [Steinernema carpocapsae]|uniref:Cadherin domain-containing protein n=1 Tax=Steinernema carpocapsae TaxID=34508 RepID=A0A4U5MCQ9_STECR|nr:hypothetical protein L596_023114 [Steinernema carpocapsae]
MTTVENVLANDSNCAGGIASRLRYELQQTSKGTKLFRVDERTGTICLTAKLDYEVTTRFQLTVEAHDPLGRTASSLVNIFIEDVNDNAPIFHPTSYNISVREDTPSGAPLLLVSATDGDYGSFGQLSYYMESGDVSFFTVDESTGQLFLKEPLNRSGKSQMFVQVQAKDGGDLVSDQPAQVTVIKIPMHSAVPQFSKLKYEFHVAEDILPGISVGRVEATGPGTITYSISSGDPDHMFSVDRYSGKITVGRYLDADHSDSVLLNVKATVDTGGSNYTQVVIHVTDTNDNDPMFEMDTIEVNVPEDYGLHEPFFAVQATDKDKHKNGELTYELIRSDPPCPVIVKPVTGQILLAASLDYETVKSYKIRIKAQDQGIPPRSAAITVIINVIDVNDNAPLFERQLYTATVPEDAKPMTELVTVKANDPDTGFNGKISYRIDYALIHPAVYGINPTSGTVYVKESLDREEKAEYFLTVIATDQGVPSKNSNTTVQIRILDINDNSPNCGTVKPLTLSDSTSVNEAIGTVEAHDPDQAENGTVRYRMQQPNEWFDIKPNGDLFVKKKLPFDVSQKVYHTTVIAQDQSSVPRSSICPVVVKVDQVMSTVTIIEPVDRILRVNIQCPPGCLLTKINATNADRWSLEANAISHFFNIKDGILSTKTTLTPEVLQSSNHLVVNVFDKDNRRKQVSFLVRPKYTNFGTTNTTRLLRFSENLPVGSLLESLGAGGDESFYSIDKNDFFDIDESNGNLYLTDRFNYARNPVHTFQLKRTSIPGFEVNQTQIVVEIQDENQFAPLFQKDYFYWKVMESILPGSLIGTVVAGDVEGDELGYRIIRTSTDRMFSVDSSSGDVFLQGNLDFYQAKQHFMVVEVADSLFRSFTTVVVEVIDINNHAPVFLSPNTITIRPDSKEKIHRFIATDHDSGDNAKIIYSMVEGSPRNAFKVDPDSGDLMLTMRLNSTAKVRVRASDSGNPPKTTEQELFVRIANESSKWMFFDRPSYEFVVHTNTVPDTIVHKFSQEGSYGVDFQLFPKTQGAFKIDKDSGEFTTNEKLEIEEYKLIVLATSFSGNETDWSTITVRSLGSQNLHTPQINPASCGNVSVPENLEIKDLRTIFATDQDQGENGRISFKIQSGNHDNLFTIDDSTGVISCSKLDRELKTEHFLVISVQDNGSPLKADTCTLRIKVLDLNDNAPVFDSSLPDTIVVTDSIEIGSVLLNLNATDPDQDTNGQVEFVLQEDRSGLFDLNPKTGALTLARDLPSLDKQWTITIRAQDRGLTVVQNRTKTLKVLNNRSKTEWSTGEPEFLREFYVASIPEGLPRGQFVAQLYTTSGITHDAPITYSIVGGNKDAAFEISEDGIIYTKQELDAEIQANYALNVIGSGKFAKSPETTVNIKVLNVNDNSPSFPPVRKRSLSENIPVGTQIAHMFSNDVDKDSILEYNLESSADTFHIDRFTGALFLKKPLDYEAVQHYDISITVSDGVHSTSTILNLDVTDENDNAPRFQADLIEISVPEGSLTPVDVGQVKATDSDKDDNGQIWYELLEKSNFMAINRHNGTLTIMEALDPGMTYFVTVRASDRGSPPLSGFCTLKINVVSQAAQTQIKFDSAFYTFTIPEDHFLFQPFGKLSILGSNSSSFTSSDPKFAVNSKGEIFLVDFIDRETSDQYRIRVDMTTKGQTSSATVIAQVSDVNDNAPVFVKNSTLDRLVISESLRVNEILTRFSASDADIGDNAKVKYSILSGGLMLSIDEDSGALRFTGWNKTAVMALDRTLATVVLRAQDQGSPSLWSMTTFEVSYDLETSSLTAPLFPVPIYVRHVSESAEKSRVILESRVRNLLGIKEQGLRYSLIDNDEVFLVNETNGEVKLQGMLDFEKRTNYEFKLMVADTKKRTTTVPVQVRVLGVDEYAPMFTRSSYSFQIPLSAEIGQRIGTVFASDTDVGIDGRVRYSMKDDKIDYVAVDPETGVLTLKNLLDPSKNFTLDQFEIVASSGPVQHSRTTVYLEIGDFPSSTASSEDFTLINLVSVITILLFVLCSASLIFLIVRIHRKNRRSQKPQKQIYSVSRGNIAVMADLNRVSPKFQRVPMPIPEMGNSTYSDDSSVILRPPRIGLRSQPQSQPDSGIDPDAISMNSSVTDYLMQLGVTSTKFDPVKPQFRHPNTDGDLSELIYANVDDIIGPGPVNLIQYNAEPLHSSFMMTPLKEPEGPKFQPLSDVFSEIARLKEDQRKKKTVKVDI